MLNDVACVSNHTGYQNLAVRQLHAFRRMILMFMTCVGCFETECACVDLQHVGNDVAECCVMDTRSLVDAVTSVKTHLRWWKISQTLVDGFHIHQSASMAVSGAELRVRENVCQEW